MNCDILTITDASSLYKNGEIIEQASATFRVRKCNNVDLKITCEMACCCNQKVNRVCFQVINNSNRRINNAILRVIVKPLNCRRCNLFNCRCKTFRINNLDSGCTDTICINFPVNCCFRQKVIGQIEVNCNIIKEESIII